MLIVQSLDGSLGYHWVTQDTERTVPVCKYGVLLECT